MPTFHRITSTVSNAILVRPSRVVVLLYACRPTHVARFVIAIVVDAIKRQQSIISRTNVGVEGFKAVAPALAYLNASPAVVLIRAVVRVMATLIDRTPDPMFSTRVQAMFSGLALTAARLRRADAQVVNVNVSDDPADTAACQKAKPVSVRAFTEYRPVPNLSARCHRASQRMAFVKFHSVNFRGEARWM